MNVYFIFRCERGMSPQALFQAYLSWARRSVQCDQTARPSVGQSALQAQAEGCLKEP